MEQIDRFARTTASICVTMNVRSNCSDFLQDDITVANQLRWKLGEIAPGVIRFKSTVDIRRSDVEAPKADRMRCVHKRTGPNTRYCTHTPTYIYSMHMRMISLSQARGSGIVAKYLPAYFGDR